MANSKQILAKIARNAKQIGLTLVSESDTKIVIEAGATDIGIEYVDAQIQKPMGGIDPTVSPFLGIGTASPGKLMFYKDAAGNLTVAQVIDSATALRALALCTAFANNVLVMDGNEGFGTAAVLAEIEGTADLLGMGQ
jgi:hypothetical protein